MRTIPIPVDVTKLNITCVKPPKPRLVNKDTGEIKRDKDGNVMYELTLLIEDEFNRMELVKVSTSPEPSVIAGEEVVPVGLVGYVWEQNGRWGISYRAQTFIPAGAGRTGAER
ncbi:hypothetical protein HS048_02360 [Planomonospora sp. ID91781]|jgi:hypothetical protein|uniref:SCO3933 family regulatory protein n=1 Tax=Planomonospora TaxID=1998 RepID=UPI00166FAEF9|nr:MULTISPECIES: hypothetical protein [Planomonospora]MBG0819602.1 hypothetical protein [Planomonospora sp. ID91781]GGL39695.1 hypothetical protein GCM10014719_45990 [Planomonospora parontospora subsp. antibiotica]GII18107.1 hypothetical protein Ppa05_48330 [Planomonospora parontospora subsp. antibiotica]